MGEDLEAVVAADFHKLDIVLKILELPGSYPDVIASVRAILKSISEETRRMNKGHE